VKTNALVLGLILGAAACKGSGDDGVEQCDNGNDDDGDGFVDCEDQDCWGACAESDCGDGFDDDGDGRIDCDDPDCVDACTFTCEDGDCAEICDNGIDDDMDFLTDCGDSDCDSVCDADGDGFQGLGGLDCDDERADVNPTMVEVPYDGLDNDCDPTTLDDDLDSDGFDGDEDCDDQSAATFPGAEEVCGNGQIDDCDAVGEPDPDICYDDRELSTADAHLTSGNSDAWAGAALAAIQDVTGDGVHELLIGAYGEDAQTGAVYMMSPPLTGDVDLSESTLYIYGESEEDWAGAALAGVGDMGGGPAYDIAVGARYDDSAGDHAGAVYLVSAGETGTLDIRIDAHAKLLAEDVGDSLGASLASAGDADGDGRADLIIGAPLAQGTTDKGVAYVIRGPVPAGYYFVADAHLRIEGEGTDDEAGCAVAGGSDVNGDGIDDVAVGACLNDYGGENAGAVYVIHGSPMSGTRPASTAEGGMQGDEEQARAGSALAFGDLDGDGAPDVVIGGPGAADGAGRAWVIASDATPFTPPLASLDGAAAGDELGSAVSAGDIDGDGQADLLVGAPYNDDGGEDAGAAYAVFGPVSGELEPDVVLLGSIPFGFAGSAVLGMPDVNGDDRDEMVVGAPFADDGAPGSGAVYMLQWGW